MTGWGGRRAGAGRPRLRPGVLAAHGERPAYAAGDRVRVSLLAEAGLPSLIGARLARAIRGALAASRRGRVAGFRAVRLAVSPGRIAFTASAPDRRSLHLGIRGLAIRLAHAVNATLARRGRVFGTRWQL